MASLEVSEDQIAATRDGFIEADEFFRHVETRCHLLLTANMKLQVLTN